MITEESSLRKQLETDNESSVRSRTEVATSSGLGSGFGLEMGELYFDISDFMADSTLVECSVHDYCPFGGFVDKICRATGQCHLLRKSRVFLPLSVATILYREGLIHFNLPLMFDESMQKNLKLNPLMVDIKSMHPYYFEFGMKVANLLGDRELSSVLLQAAERRVIVLIKLASDEVDQEIRAIALSGGLVQTASNIDQSRDLHPLAGCKRFMPAGQEEQLPPDLKLFLQSLSNSEIDLFRKHKEQLTKSLRFAFTT